MEFLKINAMILLLLVHRTLTLKRVKRIVGGNAVQFNQFTYQVSLQVNNKNVCGGGIIDDYSIITAAHCVIEKTGQFGRKFITAVIGTNDLNNPNIPSIRIGVQKIYVPAEYDRARYQIDKTYRTVGDIAVLKLEESIELRNNPQLKKLKLPLGETHDHFAGSTAILTGFGYSWIQKECPNPDSITNEFQTNGGSDGLMRFAVTRIVSNSRCDTHSKRGVTPNHICAKLDQRSPNRAEGSCYGDSGSPLVKDGNMIGVLVSTPSYCDERKAAAIFTRVTAYIDFIKNAVAERKTVGTRLAIWHRNDKFNCKNLSPVLVEI